MLNFITRIPSAKLSQDSHVWKNKDFVCLFCQLFSLEGGASVTILHLGIMNSLNQYSFWGMRGVGEHCPNISCIRAIPSEGRLALLEKLVVIQHSSNMFLEKRLSHCVFNLCRRILHSKGELSEDRHKQYEEFAMSYQKLLANSQSLADILDENMPDLPQDKPTPEGRPLCKASKQDAGAGLDVGETD